jgi:hypothetical protein
MTGRLADWLMRHFAATMIVSCLVIAVVLGICVWSVALIVGHR